MIEITELHNLNQYANFDTFSYRDKTIILYDDHRCLLTVLYEAQRLGIIDNETNLVTFDRHDDARPIYENWELISKFTKIGIDKISQRDFKNFVEFDIREFDDDWVCVGMELGLINNIVNVGNVDGTNIDNWVNRIYIDMLGRKHLGQVINHIPDELSRIGGALGDRVRYNDFKIVRDVLGYNLPGTQDGFADTETNYVLDFDLDCFTADCQGRTFAWPEPIFQDIYGYGDNGAGYIMQDVIKRARFITICREPSYCGGIGESNKILAYLDKYFFHDSLGTKSI